MHQLLGEKLKRLDHTYLLVLEGLLPRWEAGVAHCGEEDTDSGSSGKYSLRWALLEVAIFSPRPSPTQQPVSSSAETPQAKQSTGQEYSPTHQQTGCLTSSWAWPCPPGGRPSTHQWTGTSSSHQEACVSILASSTRFQIIKARMIAACGIETAITES